MKTTITSALGVVNKH